MKFFLASCVLESLGVDTQIASLIEPSPIATCFSKYVALMEDS